jgi:hypothetical protein
MIMKKILSVCVLLRRSSDASTAAAMAAPRVAATHIPNMICLVLRDAMLLISKILVAARKQLLINSSPKSTGSRLWMNII